MLKQKDLLGTRDLSIDETELIINSAKTFKGLLLKNVKKLPHLKGKTMTTLFYENSTRTRTSFELAAKYLSASTANVSESSSSVKKGETLADTGKTLEYLKNDFLVIRHPMSGAAAFLAANVSCSVINGGDGTNEHPTQALLDFYTIREKYDKIDGLKVVIAGDILHSRVAKSNIYLLTKYGANITLFAPKSLMPSGIENLGVNICYEKQTALKSADVIIGLRIQKERQDAGLFPSLSEYAQIYGINDCDIQNYSRDALVLHPGPVNRGVEFTSSVIDGEASKINEQVLNGISVRMAILTLLKGGAV